MRRQERQHVPGSNGSPGENAQKLSEPSGESVVGVLLCGRGVGGDVVVGGDGGVVAVSGRLSLPTLLLCALRCPLPLYYSAESDSYRKQARELELYVGAVDRL
ncbi:Hypothetical predicted protein [Xyrichtys novacula]|uniref:Uncharacterized protein n=1 Tax=Xyrichtys novacula TaxID=13765 RepID=A0AAV1GLR4_XYRNO|nr:Hypothetical predicted protein [Xyrichtys novacula]